VNVLKGHFWPLEKISFDQANCYELGYDLEEGALKIAKLVRAQSQAKRHFLRLTQRDNAEHTLLL